MLIMIEKNMLIGIITNDTGTFGLNFLDILGKDI